MEVLYKSTRDLNEKTVTASQAILKGLADDGGLFVPTAVPALTKSVTELSKMNYQDVAFTVMKSFFTDFTDEELMHCINSAYDSKFETPEIAPLVKEGDAHFLELYHGATIAFKDMALSILPHLLTTSAKKNNIKNDIVILTATSGDTGKAALAGFADVPGTKIIVFYPKGGVSRVQELQMVTQKGDNTHVIGITGNFDQAQSGVKAIFGNKELAANLDKAGYQFSSANSINIGRLIPQVAYYVYAYSRLIKNGEIKEGEAVNFVVPTGNFGNILAGYYASLMGIPVGKLICASNDNKVLYDFFRTGVYDKNREFILTTSPSMDILISSNLERLIYGICDFSAEKNAALMQGLAKEGKYEVSADMMKKIDKFCGYYATEAEGAEVIKEYFRDQAYIMDTHTAVAAASYRKYKQETSDETKTVIVSTASPYKFSRSVMTAINAQYDKMEDFELIDELSKLSKTDLPNAIKEIKNANILHNTVCAPEEMQNEVCKYLGV